MVDAEVWRRFRDILNGGTFPPAGLLFWHIEVTAGCLLLFETAVRIEF